MVELRQLGKNGPVVNPLGLGCMGMSSGVFGPADDAESIKVLERALDLGCAFWDTANVYGQGHNERLLSQILKTRRKDVFLATKFGIQRDETGMKVCGKPEYVRKCCEESLQRLGVETIDLYYLHRLDKDTPIEKTVAAMAELVKEGKVRYLGLSECSAATLRRAHAVHPITAIQMEYSPWFLNIEQNGVLETARELGVAIVCFSPLGRGILTGAIKSLDDLAEDDFRRKLPRFSPENFSRNLQLVRQIENLAAKKGVKPSQLVLAWILAQGPEFFVIPGTKKIKYLEENMGAAQVQLSNEEVQEIRALVTAADVAGERYGPDMMWAVDQ